MNKFLYILFLIILAPTYCLASATTITHPASLSYVNATNISMLPASGACPANTQVLTIVVKDANSNQYSQTATCSNYTWSSSLNLSALTEGNLTIFLKDANGTVLTPNVSFIKDTISPTIVITNPQINTSINSVTSKSFSLSGTCSQSGGTMSYQFNDSTNKPIYYKSIPNGCINNAFNLSGIDLSLLSDGNITLKMVHYDLAMNSKSQQISLQKDIIAPSIAITNPQINTLMNFNASKSFSLSGTCSQSGGTMSYEFTDSSNRPIYKLIPNGCINNAFNLSGIDLSSLIDGNITLKMAHYDLAMNSKTQALALKKDATGPSLKLETFGPDSMTKYLSPSIPVTIQWSTKDLDLKNSITIDLSQDNGVTYQTISTVDKAAISYNFTPAPNISCAPNCLIRLSAEDMAGNIAYKMSEPIAVLPNDLNLSTLSVLEDRHPGEINKVAGYEVGSTTISYTDAINNKNILKYSIADLAFKNINGTTVIPVNLGGTGVRYAPRIFDLLKMRENFVDSSGQTFDVAMLGTWNTANFTDPTSPTGWTYTGEGTNKIMVDGITDHGTPYPISLSSNGLRLNYRAGDSLSAAGHPRVQLNSYALPTQKRLVYDMSVQLGEAGNEDATWPLNPLVPTGHDSILIFQIKSDTMLPVKVGTSNQPAIGISVYKDLNHEGRVSLVLARCKWNPCSDSNWSTWSNTDIRGQRSPDAIATVDNLKRGEPIDFLIDSYIDWNSNGWIKFYVNGKKIALKSNFTPALDTNYDSGLRTIPLQRFDMDNSPGKVAINNLYTMSFGMYMFNVGTPPSYNRSQNWNRMRVLTTP